MNNTYSYKGGTISESYWSRGDCQALGLQYSDEGFVVEYRTGEGRPFINAKSVRAAKRAITKANKDH